MFHMCSVKHMLLWQCGMMYKHPMGSYAMYAPIEHLSYSTSIQTVVTTCSTLVLSTYILCDSFNM